MGAVEVGQQEPECRGTFSESDSGAFSCCHPAGETPAADMQRLTNMKFALPVTLNANKKVESCSMSAKIAVGT